MIPLATLSEQDLIISKLENIFSSLNKGDERLVEIKNSLRNLKGAALESAIKGKLTLKWRESNIDKLEPASILFERLIKEKYEKSIKNKKVKLDIKGNLHLNDSIKMQINHALILKNEELRPLPEKWGWAKVSQIGELKLGRQRAPRYHNGPNMKPYLRVANVMENYIDTSDILEMEFSQKDYELYHLNFGDILLNEGQSLELIGRPAIFKGELPDVCFQNTIIRFRPFKSMVSEYVFYVFLAYFYNGNFKRIAKWTTSIAHLSIGRLAELEFPLPPEEEQKLIVKYLHLYINSADALEKQLDNILAQAELMGRAVLKKAFEGKFDIQIISNNISDHGRNIYGPSHGELDAIFGITLDEEQVDVNAYKVGYDNARKGVSTSSIDSAQDTNKYPEILIKEKKKRKKPSKKLPYKKMNIIESLRSMPKPVTPKDLLIFSGLDVSSFYLQLGKELQKGRIREVRPTDKDIFLETVDEIR